MLSSQTVTKWWSHHPSKYTRSVCFSGRTDRFDERKFSVADESFKQTVLKKNYPKKQKSYKKQSEKFLVDFKWQWFCSLKWMWEQNKSEHWIERRKVEESRRRRDFPIVWKINCKNVTSRICISPERTKKKTSSRTTIEFWTQRHINRKKQRTDKKFSNIGHEKASFRFELKENRVCGVEEKNIHILK